MKVKELAKILDAIFPKNIQESYDNCGLIIGDEDTQVSGILTTMDVTLETIEEAIKKECNVIVAHHPTIFRGIKNIVDNSYNNQVVINAIRGGISIYAAHTSLDNTFQDSLNYELAKKIGLTKINPLKRTDVSGSGAYGILEEPVYIIDYLFSLRNIIKSDSPIRFNKPGQNVLISKIALCTGAGSFMITDAKRAGAELFLTGEIGYHTFFEERDIHIAEIGHYGSECHASSVIAAMIKKSCSMALTDRLLTPSIYLNPAVVMESTTQYSPIGHTY